MNFFKLKNIFVIIIPFTLYLSHIFLFREWIIDDAGISFVYARNLANGYGLVSQPGVQPLEGYSNFTWVLLLTPFHLLNIFDPILIPKIISVILIFLSFIIMQKTIELINPDSVLVVFLSLIFISINTSFVVWTSSGLENPFFLFLGLTILYFLIRLSFNLEIKNVIALSVAVALISMTRPEGIIFFFLPVILLPTGYFFFNNSGKIINKNLVIYLTIFLLIYGSYLLFKLVYFKDIFPNTFYAKEGLMYNKYYGSVFGNLKSLIRLKPEMYNKMYILINGTINIWGIYLSGGLILATAYLAYLGELTKQNIILLLMIIFSLTTYLLLPTDWMGEFRFATLFFPLFYAYLFIIGYKLLRKFFPTKILKLIFTSILLVIITIPAFNNFVERSKNFAQHPTVPFSEVAEYFGSKYDSYANILKIENASLLLPDVGATLYYSNLRIYDLAGLIDKKIAKAKSSEDISDYIFEVIKPTFIHKHGKWAYFANFEADERFQRDYFPIWEKPEHSRNNEFPGLRVYAGDYVRRDVLEKNQDFFNKIFDN